MNKKLIIDEYKGMNYQQSVDHQVKHWADGIPTHNPIGDECCPDFSCCNPSSLMDEGARKRFLNAHLSGDDETKSKMSLMCLGELLSDENVYIAGEDHDMPEQ